MNQFVVIVLLIVAISTINYILAARENKKTFAALKEYMADPNHIREVVIDNEKGYSIGRIHFIGGGTYYYNGVIQHEESILSMLESGGVNVIYVHDHEYGLPFMNNHVLV